VLKPSSVAALDDGSLESAPEDVEQGGCESEGAGIRIAVLCADMAPGRAVPTFSRTRGRNRSDTEDARIVPLMCGFLLLVETSRGSRRFSESEVDQR
jgi:hypothetical protein